MKIIGCFLLVLCFAWIGVAQGNEQKKLKGFEIPSKYISLYLVNGRNTPIELLEETTVIGYENQTFEYLFHMKSNTDKSICEFEINATNWFGSKGFRETYKIDKQTPFLQNQIRSSLEGKEIVGLETMEGSLAQKLNLYDNPREIFVLMVTRVVFDDGSVYDDRVKFKEIEKFINKIELNSKMSKSEISLREKELYEYITKLMLSN
jgi:hypothetical protein